MSLLREHLEQTRTKPKCDFFDHKVQTETVS